MPPGDDTEEIPTTRQHSLPPRRRGTLVLTEAQMRGEAPVGPAADAPTPDDAPTGEFELELEGVPFMAEDEPTLPRLRVEPDPRQEMAETGVHALERAAEAPARGRPQMTRADDLEEFDSPSIIGRPPRP